MQHVPLRRDSDHYRLQQLQLSCPISIPQQSEGSSGPSRSAASSSWGPSRHSSSAENKSGGAARRLQFARHDVTAKVPALEAPELPKLAPGKPLDAAQRSELIALRQQVQARLAQQRLLIESIRQLPQFQANQQGEAVPSFDALLEEMRSGMHLVGPDPVGDLPADAPEEEEEDADASFVPAPPPARAPEEEQHKEEAWARFDGPSAEECLALGTFSKLHVELNKEISLFAPNNEDGGPLDSFARVPCPTCLGAEGEPMLIPAMPERSRGLPHRVVGIEDASTASQSGRSAASSSQTGSSSCLPRPLDNVAPDAASVQHQRAVPSQHGCEAPPAADPALLGSEPPGVEDRRWIDATVRRMFRSLGPETLLQIANSFREWRLPASVAIQQQSAPISTGPGVCVLTSGVVDVFHHPLKAGEEAQKVCTYDRCGQSFGDLELIYEPMSSTPRKSHWASVVTRTPVVLWVVDRQLLQAAVNHQRCPASSTRLPVAPGKNTFFRRDV